MTNVYSKALRETIQINRIIGEYKGESSGPTLLFIAGIHGNEPSGIFALKNVLSYLKATTINFKGNVFAIGGNLNALDKGIRFNDVDLNRIWNEKTVSEIRDGRNFSSEKESIEQREIYAVIKNILDKSTGPVYFFDLHTTSSETTPFITVNDSLLNRRFTQQYPIPKILGIEEFLEGPLLSYVNELGYIAFGYEGGQHDSLASIENHIAFIYLSFVFCGNIKKSEIDYQKYYDLLCKNLMNSQTIFEITKRHEIQPKETFQMEPGFSNFLPIKKGVLLAKSNGKDIVAEKNARIFMPLYQGKGNDGFFIIRKVPYIFLKLSTIVRILHFDKILPILPGVKWANDKKDELIVNLTIARFFPKQFFHLLGYRSKQIDKIYMRIKNREAASKTSDYKNASWMR